MFQRYALSSYALPCSLLKVVKSFSVYNDLPQAVLVSMQYDAEELSQSNPVSQVQGAREPLPQTNYYCFFLLDEGLE